MSDWNKATIDEFRANEGRVGGFFEGKPILLLHSFGAKTGAEQVNPVMYDAQETETIPVTARVAAPEEREPIWRKWIAAHSNFAEYETKTPRKIPVVILDRR